MTPQLQKEEQFVDFFSRLVAIPSHSGNETEIAHFIATEFQQVTPNHTVITQSYDNAGGRNVIIRAREPRLLIDVHLDTVTPGNESSWINRPYVLTLTDTAFVGLGAVDVKVNIALCYWLAMCGLANNISFAFTGGEETVAAGVKHLLASTEVQGINRVLVCEPTMSQIHSTHKGCYGITIAFADGASGHSSIADYTSSAQWQMVDFLTRLRAAVTTAVPGSSFSDVSFVVGELASMTESGRGTCTAFVMFRLPATTDRAAFLNAFTEILQGGTVMNDLYFPGSHNTAPWCDAQSTVLPFWAHAGMYAEAGCNVVVAGPGSIDQAHTYDEYVTFDQVNLFWKQLVRLVEKL